MPKLTAEQFECSDHLTVQTVFAGKRLDVKYVNSKRLTYGGYCIGRILVNGIERPLSSKDCSIRIPREEVLTWPEHVNLEITLTGNETA